MVDILRVKINWTGFVGAPGYTNLYFNEFNESGQTQAIADACVAKTDTWLTAMAIRMPAAVKTVVDPVVDIIESTTGALTGFFNTTPAAQRTGGTAGVYAAASGACINWYTAGVRNGRRVRGRTFLVPLGGSMYAADGTLDDASAGFMRTATATLISNVGTGDLGVWARPTAPGATDGEWFSTTAFTLPDKAAVLTSRRD